MPKAFKYRLRPTAKQATQLAFHLEECRMLYNHLLMDRIQAYTDRGQSLTFYGQKSTLPTLKEQRTTLAHIAKGIFR